MKNKGGLSLLVTVIIVLLCFQPCAGTADTVYKTVDISTSAIASTEPATNVGFGLVLPSYRPGSNDQPDLKARYPYINIAYKRFLWSELEPEEGRYDFSILEQWITHWKNRGYRVGFGVMSTTVGNQGTPPWVFQAGVPGIAHMQGRQTDPVMWNDIYLQKLDNFVRALGARLDGGRGIEFVDIRGIGVWGEMHFGFGTKGMWTQDELYENGLSEDRLTEAYFRQVVSYRHAFPYTTLFLNISGDQERILKQRPHMKKYFLPRKNSDYQRMGDRMVVNKPFILPVSPEIHKRAVALGIGLRSDGLSEEELTFGSAASYFRDYCRPGGPVKCFFEFAAENLSPADAKKILAYAVNNYASYININFQALKDMSAEMSDILQDAAKRIGYQCYLEKLSLQYPAVISKGSSATVHIDQRWTNRGNITTKETFVLQFSLLDNAGTVIAEHTLAPATPVSLWMPGRAVNFESSIPIPPGLKDGVHVLAVRMIDSAGRPIGLNLKQIRPDDLLYPLVRFYVATGDAGNITLRLAE